MRMPASLSPLAHLQTDLDRMLDALLDVVVSTSRMQFLGNVFA